MFNSTKAYLLSTGIASAVTGLRFYYVGAQNVTDTEYLAATATAAADITAGLLNVASYCLPNNTKLSLLSTGANIAATTANATTIGVIGYSHFKGEDLGYDFHGLGAKIKSFLVSENNLELEHPIVHQEVEYYLPLDPQHQPVVNQPNLNNDFGDPEPINPNHGLRPVNMVGQPELQQHEGNHDADIGDLFGSDEY